jgi:hypothetical protein
MHVGESHRPAVGGGLRWSGFGSFGRNVRKKKSVSSTASPISPGDSGSSMETIDIRALQQGGGDVNRQQTPDHVDE